MCARWLVAFAAISIIHNRQSCTNVLIGAIRISIITRQRFGLSAQFSEDCSLITTAYATASYF